MLGIGADVGVFTSAFLKEFPDCEKTFLGPEMNCLDPLKEGKAFDFIRIDARGAEIEIIDSGAELLRKADYILIKAPAEERARIVFEKLKEMGFRCADAGSFFLPIGDANSQTDFLFERLVPRATQNNRYGNPDRSPVLEFLKEQKAACPDFSVLDIGAAARPWAADVLTATFDLGECTAAPFHFKGNLNKRSDWVPLLQHVAAHGKFSYTVCTHTLEDLAYPMLALEMLPLVSEAGFIAVPSKYLELSRPEGPWRGYIHHRWIFCLKDGEVIMVPKVPIIEYLQYPNEESWNKSADVKEVQIFWRKNLAYSIINDDCLSPNASGVINMYSTLLASV